MHYIIFQRVDVSRSKLFAKDPRWFDSRKETAPVSNHALLWTLTSGSTVFRLIVDNFYQQKGYLF